MIENKIREALTEIFKKQKIPKNINNLKFGSFKNWDSLNHLNLLLLIEVRLKIKFTMTEMSEIKTIKGLLKIIRNK
jgi:acyl carrier protein|tara:strand:+ start:1905 stop:2132 length:228 start_codon:yes stop_codon:yes gene_type:complete